MTASEMRNCGQQDIDKGRLWKGQLQGRAASATGLVGNGRTWGHVLQCRKISQSLMNNVPQPLHEEQEQASRKALAEVKIAINNLDTVATSIRPTASALAYE